MPNCQKRELKSRWSVFLATAICIFGFGMLFGAKTDTAIKGLFVATQPSHRYLDRLERLGRFPPRGRIALIGNSHIERGPWSEPLSADIANFGIGGDGVESVRRRIGSLEPTMLAVWRPAFAVRVRSSMGGYSS
ncbi:MAG: hypothetical protein LC637_11250 [Xanthomonadaceae bacterium]|nr:hypothetical protein [Xanthomonadaceae bacterium]